MRHIDADAITPDIVQSYTANADVYLVIRKILDDAPTADVVTMAEEKIDSLKKECAYWEAEAKEARADLTESTREIARLIFKDIRMLCIHIDNVYDAMRLEALAKKYTEGE